MEVIRLIKEISIGTVLAALIFLALKGIDIVPFIFLLGFFGAMYYLAGNRGLVKSVNLHKGNANTKIDKTTFEDIGGQDMAIKELKEALDFIKNYDKIKELGIRPLKGVLLTGPPGTGKTLLAKAAATYTDAVFLATSGSEFIEMYAGVGAQRVRKLFSSAREQAVKGNKSNAIIFIDEIDVLGGKRGQNSGHQEYDQTLNQLLVEMDGLKTEDSVKLLLVAATNRVDILDPALLRPGRFDRHVKVDLPSREGRAQILNIHTKNKPMAKDVDLKEIAKETFGFSGAHLESLANEAAIYAFREGSKKLTRANFKEAVDKVIMGEKLDTRPNSEELYRVAVHETGHALVSEILRPGSVSTLTISPRGNALGYMRQTPEDDAYLYTKEYLENQICVMLGGAVAEEIVLNNRSTGASNDFQQAVNVAKKIVYCGLSSLGVVAEDHVPQNILHKEISAIIGAQEQRVIANLKSYEHQIKGIVETVLDRERLSGEEFRNLAFDEAQNEPTVIDPKETNETGLAAKLGAKLKLG